MPTIQTDGPPPLQSQIPNTFTCTCSNGTTPALGAYAETFVSDECQARFAACRQQNPGSDACIKCGMLKADDVPASTSSMAAASTAAATSTAAGGAASAAGAANPGQTSNAAMLVGAEMGVKGAVGLLAAMGLVL
ncbi:MAG: hypothetical protein Q9181_005387 [Wetmoreana brouardii]